VQTKTIPSLEVQTKAFLDVVVQTETIVADEVQTKALVCDDEVHKLDQALGRVVERPTNSEAKRTNSISELGVE
jgi:hypothetical protein